MIVTIEQLKAHLRVQHEDEDALLSDLLEQALGAAADFCLTAFDESAPQPVRLAVLLMAGHLYEYRSAHDRRAYTTMRMAFESLLWPYRDTGKLF